MAVTTTTNKIAPQLDDKNRARLESKTYKKLYTDIPNKALPESYRTGLAAIFRALTGEDFDPESSTFTVRADSSGVFKRLYSPTVFSTEEGGLIVRWGDRDIPLEVSNDKISTAKAAKGTKFSFKEEQIGKYKEPALSVSTTSDGVLHTLPIPIRSANFEDKVSVELLELLLSENPEAIAEKVALATDLSKRNNSEISDAKPRMVGHYVKVAHLPIGEYNVTTYRAKEGGQYGTKYYLQVQIPEPFSAPIRVKRGDEWLTEEAEVSDWAVVEPNTTLKKTLAAEPVITPDAPAVLRVEKHGEYNGFPTATCVLRCQTFAEDPESFSLAF